jgi:hypothetical protein
MESSPFSRKSPEGSSLQPRREFLRLAITGAAGLPLVGAFGGCQAPTRQPHGSADAGVRPQTTWGITTNIDVWPLYAPTVESAIANVGPLLLETGCTCVRDGMQSDMKGNDLDPINWGLWFDPWVDWLDAHGIRLCLQLGLNSVRNDSLSYDAAWEERVIHKCRETARYIKASPQRRRVVAWVLLINEPDLKTGRAGGFLTPQRLLRYHELAWNTIKSVDPTLLIEGLSFGDGAGIGASFPLRAFNLNTADHGGPEEHPTPGKSVPGMVIEDMMDIGITRFCDIVGFHSYLEITEDNPYGARALVARMRSAHDRFGFPVRPVVNTETGPHDTQFNRIRAGRGNGRRPIDVSVEANYAALAHWQQLNRVQQARWGVARSIYYLLSGSPGAPWMQIADYPMKRFNPPAHFGPFRYDGPPYAKRPSFATAVAALAPKPLATLNGGFEEPEDKFSNWVVHFHPHDFRSDDLVYGEWKQTHFLRDGASTGIRAPESSGVGYLRLDPGLPKLVRRVVEVLPADTTYELSAWVRQEAGATSTLAAYGFDQNLPDRSALASSKDAGRWRRLSVRFTTRRSVVGVDSWVVVSLEHDGGATAFWDDVSIVRV